MIKRITLENFMNHKKTTIVLSEGVTILTGPNNIGKSAIVEAIRSVAENPPSQELIRHKAKKGVVHIELDSGEVITWERTENSVRYAITTGDKKQEGYAKIGRGVVPEDIKNTLKIQPVETDDIELNLHIAPQKDPIFIPSGTQAADFFAASTEAFYLVKMQHLLKAKVDAKKDRKKQIVAELEKLRDLIKKYEPIKQLEEAFNASKIIKNEVDLLAREIPLLQEAIETVKASIEMVLSATKRWMILKKLQEPPLLKESFRLQQTLREIDTKEKELVSLRRWVSAFERLKSPPDLLPAKALSHIVEELSRAEGLLLVHKKSAKITDGLFPPPSLKRTYPLSNTIEEIFRAALYLKRCVRTLAKYEELTSPPELKPATHISAVIFEINRLYTEKCMQEKTIGLLNKMTHPPDVKNLKELKDLQDVITRIRSLIHEIAEVRKEKNTLEETLREHRRIVAAFIANLKVCPLCNQPLSIDYLLQGRV